MNDADIRDLFSGLGSVTIKRMFGGKGIYHQGLIVAVELRDELMLKADGVSAPELEAAGAKRWTYEGKNGNSVQMPYWSIPPEGFDDPDQMARWARLAFDAARRSSAGKGSCDG